MTREIGRLVVSVRPTAVFHVEDGAVWLSGMNANVGRLARHTRRKLDREGYHVGEVEDDDAARNSGLIVPVEEAEDVEESEFYTDEVRSDGGDITLPLEVDPERLNTEGVSSPPSTFEDRKDEDRPDLSSVENNTAYPRSSLLSRIPLLGRWFR